MKAAIKELRGGRHVTDQNTENQYNALKKYGIHLNQRALDGKLDPIIGRDDEIRRILHILSRRKKDEGSSHPPGCYIQPDAENVSEAPRCGSWVSLVLTRMISGKSATPGRPG